MQQQRDNNIETETKSFNGMFDSIADFSTGCESRRLDPGAAVLVRHPDRRGALPLRPGLRQPLLQELLRQGLGKVGLERQVRHPWGSQGSMQLHIRRIRGMLR